MQPAPFNIHFCFNPLKPNDHYSGRTASLTSKLCILYIYSTNTGPEYFKHGLCSPFFSFQNAVCFIILTYLVLVLFTFYIQSVLKLKKNNSGTKRLILNSTVSSHSFRFFTEIRSDFSSKILYASILLSPIRAKFQPIHPSCIRTTVSGKE